MKDTGILFTDCAPLYQGVLHPFDESLPVRFPYNTIGKPSTFFVWTRVKASKSSYIVPKPPGKTTKPVEYFTNISFLTKKYMNDKLMSR